MRQVERRRAALGLTAAIALAPALAQASPVLFVGRDEALRTSRVTQVALLRDGDRTVVSIASDYEGPPQDFAMVVPVPRVVRARDVKVLPPELFDRVDALTAPRLVELWERDPCDDAPDYRISAYSVDGAIVPVAKDPRDRPVSFEPGVIVDAQFAVGEYEIATLSARSSLGVEAWLRARGYQVPEGVAEALRSYVQRGMKFLVANVDVDKVRRDASGRVRLSPLRFHYDDPIFRIPVVVGLPSAADAHDMFLYVLARGVRYQVAEYDNIVIPTNLDVRDAVRDGFARFYAALFNEIVQEFPDAIVTEYTWSTASCDPCPVEPLNVHELAALGLDALPAYRRWFVHPRTTSELRLGATLVLTRLHARFSGRSRGHDMVLKAGLSIVGGHERWSDDTWISHGYLSVLDAGDAFQARYVVRHPWRGPIECEAPRPGRWGLSPAGDASTLTTASADELAFAEPDAPLERSLVTERRRIHVRPMRTYDGRPLPESLPSCRVDDTAPPRGALLLGLFAAVGRRRSRNDARDRRVA